MSTQRVFDGELSQFETPDWRPLEQLVDDDVADLFMWMHEVQLSDGSLVQAYKHIHTRRYIHADSAGRTFLYVSELVDIEAAKRLCEEMKRESQFMHDLLVDGVAGLISFVKEELGDEGVERAWTYSLERSWKGPVEAIAASDRREIAKALAATWRA